MEQLPEHLELVITDKDVDDEWQLIDIEATLGSYHEQIRGLDAQLAEAFHNGSHS
jgi:hypothetical protein